LGQAYLARKDFSQALKTLTHGLKLAEERGQAGATWNATTAIGSVYQQTGRALEAIQYFKRAIGVIETTRALLKSAETRASFFYDKTLIYSGVIQAYLESRNMEEAFNYNERARSRAFLDVLGSRLRLSRTYAGKNFEELLARRVSAAVALENDDDMAVDAPDDVDIPKLEEDYDAFVTKARQENKEQASLMAVEPLKLKEVQALLERGQTLVQYFVTGEKTFLWVLERGHLEAEVLSISQRDLEQKVDGLRKSIAELKPLREYQSLAREIHELLIRPALPHVKGKELIIVPHGILHYLPFQALYSPRGKYLVEDYAVSYLSSASLMQFTKEKKKVRGQRVLALGNPDLGDPTKELKFAEGEVDEIKKLYPSSTVLLRNGATKTRAKELSSRYDILHFAAHAELNRDDPLSSALLLAKGDGDEGRLQVREVFEMDLKAGLVVLSGCETGLGKLSSGDEFVGLTRAFIYAGTPSVVASLWKVDDASTAYLMSSFYKNLKTKSKVESLRQAQLELIRGKPNSQLLAQRGVGGIGKLGETPGSMLAAPGSVPASHPYFWAPFILVGDGR
jgi:CHAT domain-containing protein